jgi:hypothetical protein
MLRRHNRRLPGRRRQPGWSGQLVLGRSVSELVDEAHGCSSVGLEKVLMIH